MRTLVTAAMPWIVVVVVVFASIGVQTTAAWRHNEYELGTERSPSARDNGGYDAPEPNYRDEALQTLDLSKKRLETFEPKAFRGLPNLKTLNLSNNRLRGSSQ